MTKARRGKASLKEKKAEELASLEAPDDQNQCSSRRNRITSWGKRMDPRPTFQCLAEDDEDEQVGLNHLVPRHAGAQWTWKKVTVVVDSGAAENVMPRSMFPEISTEEKERSKKGKGSKGRGGEHIKMGSDLCPSELLNDSGARATWQVADVRRPLVSIQAGNDLFIGKNEVYMTTKKKQEISVLRKEGNVYMFDLFVKAPIMYKPMEFDAINQVPDGREQRKRVTFDCSRSERGRQVQAN